MQEAVLFYGLVPEDMHDRRWKQASKRYEAQVGQETSSDPDHQVGIFPLLSGNCVAICESMQTTGSDNDNLIALDIDKLATCAAPEWNGMLEDFCDEWEIAAFFQEPCWYIGLRKP